MSDSVSDYETSSLDEYSNFSSGEINETSNEYSNTNGNIKHQKSDKFLKKIACSKKLVILFLFVFSVGICVGMFILFLILLIVKPKMFTKEQIYFIDTNDINENSCLSDGIYFKSYENKKTVGELVYNSYCGDYISTIFKDDEYDIGYDPDNFKPGIYTCITRCQECYFTKYDAICSIVAENSVDAYLKCHTGMEETCYDVKCKPTGYFDCHFDCEDVSHDLDK